MAMLLGARLAQCVCVGIKILIGSWLGARSPHGRRTVAVRSPFWGIRATFTLNAAQRTLNGRSTDTVNVALLIRLLVRGHLKNILNN